jgi:alkyl hydroperoxide reductase subunit AhpC
MFIIDDKGILRQITINDRPVGRSVPEALRLIQTIQHAEKLRESACTGDFVEGKKILNYISIHLY